ncbi:hypothetical protein LF817_09005 [Halobacillus sp. A1]|uniref:hypothetical protein n=1 Tax=Halobacillus sp. A1 TaxID=2880262 RepID=UPI0020A62470|nr:hypothetical protein [Halobacillus sp. A1]MCP3031485.1 hypothetical protein [Halobacillus sp. A1]
MERNASESIPLANIWLDNTPTSYTQAFVERLSYEWMIEIINPRPIPLIEDKEIIQQISFKQIDGQAISNADIQFFEMMEEEEVTVYRFFVYPQEG